MNNLQENKDPERIDLGKINKGNKNPENKDRLSLKREKTTKTEMKGNPEEEIKGPLAKKGLLLIRPLDKDSMTILQFMLVLIYN